MRIYWGSPGQSHHSPPPSPYDMICDVCTERQSRNKNLTWQGWLLGQPPLWPQLWLGHRPQRQFHSEGSFEEMFWVHRRCSWTCPIWPRVFSLFCRCRNSKGCVAAQRASLLPHSCSQPAIGCCTLTHDLQALRRKKTEKGWCRDLRLILCIILMLLTHYI